MSTSFGQEISNDLIEYPHQFQKFENDIRENEQMIFSNSEDPIFGDFRVNEQVGNSNKSYVKSAINDNGISAIVWCDYREGTPNIYIQFLSSTGDMIGGNLKVNEANDGKIYNHSSISVNNENNFLIIWSDVSSGYSIMGQIIDEQGDFIGGNFKIDDEDNNAYKTYPNIASNGNEFVVSWTDARNGYTYDIYAQRLDISGNKIGANFIVNQDSQGVSKYYSSIALNDSGSFLVSWQATVNGANQIYSVAMDKDNNIISNQTLLNDSTAIASNSYGPSSIKSSDGFLTVWYTYAESSYHIIGQFLDSTGAKLDSNFFVNDDISSNQFYPSASSDSMGNIIITWLDYRSGSKVFAQKLKNNLPDGDNFIISEEELNGSKLYMASALNNDGSFVAHWLDYTEPTEYRIYARQFDSENNPISASKRIDDDLFSSSEEAPSLEVFEDGSFIILWSDKRFRNTRPYFQRYDQDANPIGENIAVSKSGNQSNPKIVKLKNENYLILWREYASITPRKYNVYAQKYFSTGETIGDKFIASDTDLLGDVKNFEVASNSTGEFAVVWEHRINGLYRIYAQSFNNDGGIVSQAKLVAADTTKYYYVPDIAISPSGAFSVTYYAQNPGRYDIYLNRFNSEGTALDSAIVVNDNTNNTYNYRPKITINNKDESIIAWEDGRNPRGIYFQKYENMGSADLFEKVDSNKKVVDYSLSGYYSSVSLNDSGDFAISWEEFSDSKRDVKTRLFNSDGNPYGEEFYVSASKDRNQEQAAVFFAADKIYYTWEDNHESGVGYDIWANIYDFSEYVTDIEANDITLPQEFSLEQNYPNPFNPKTIIEYSVPNVVVNNASPLQLRVYDILGREVKVLVNKYQQPGNYKIEFDASGLTSGMYFYKIDVGDYSKVKKMLLIK